MSTINELEHGDVAGRFSADAAEAPTEDSGYSRATDGALSPTGTDHLLTLVGRLERALDRAPAMLASVQATLSRADLTLQEFSVSAEVMERQVQVAQRHTHGLAQACGTAERLQGSLSERVNSLTHVSDAAQDKVAQLLSGLEAGKTTRKQLEDLVSNAGTAIERSERSAAQSAAKLSEVAGTLLGEISGLHTKHLAEINETCHQLDRRRDSVIQEVERLGDAARGSAEQAESTARSAVGELSGLHTKHLAVINQTRHQLDRRLESMIQEVERLGDAARGGAEQAESAARSAVGEMERAAQAQADRVATTRRTFEASLEATASRHSAALQVTGEKMASELQASADAHLAALQDQMLKHRTAVEGAHAKSMGDAQELLSRLDRAGDAVEKSKTVADERLAEMRRVVERHTIELRESAAREVAQIHAVVENKVRQLASQLDAATAASRMTVGATKDAHQVLTSLLQNHDAGEQQIRKLREETKVAQEQAATIAAERQAAELAAATLAEQREHAEPSVEALRACHERAAEKADHLERLIQDAWSLTTTAQDRARQLSERITQADETNQTLSGACAQAHGLAGTLAGLNLSARKRVEDTRRATLACEQAAERVSATCDTAAQSAASLGQAADHARAQTQGLHDGLQRCDQVANRLPQQAAESVKMEARLQEQLAAAAAMAADQEAAFAVQRAVAEDLRNHTAQGTELVQELSQVSNEGRKLQQALEGTTARAADLSTGMAELLAGLAERGEVLESSEHALNDLLTRAENLRVKLQQLQTRTDSFDHQIHGMLADPRRIVDEAKAQADQLDGVCRAVRKVFAGLSQATLQANRDIARYTSVSREANGRLAQLSSETLRAADTLREWVDEAAHAQSRLSKALYQTPPIGVTHPTVVLDELAKASQDALPAILQPFQRPGIRHRTRTTPAERAADRAVEQAARIKDLLDPPGTTPNAPDNRPLQQV